MELGTSSSLDSPVYVPVLFDNCCVIFALHVIEFQYQMLVTKCKTTVV